jgi:crotonobetainyl-CoA:carnitine CoA-transferase CaiB-like acyl-CoA transferase
VTGALLRLRVLDLSRYAPGPFCTLILAALGAEVIKVEAPPSGDPLRELDPDAFERLNAGKKEHRPRSQERQR